MESVANGFAIFFVVFRENTPSRTEVDCDTVQQTGVLLSSTTSDQIRRIPKRLMLELEVKVATKSLVHIYPYICIHTYIYIYTYIYIHMQISLNLVIFHKTSKFLNQNNFGIIP